MTGDDDEPLCAVEGCLCRNRAHVEELLDDGYRSAYEACAAAGITYRQLDYWVNVGIIDPSVPAYGSGTARRFSPDDVEALCIAGDLVRLGVNARALRRWDRDERLRVRDAIRTALRVVR